MSFYAVKNDKGEWWDFEAYDGFWGDDSCECAVTAYKESADSVIKERGGHVVELVEAPAKVVVSEAEAEMLEGVKRGWHSVRNLFEDVSVAQFDRLMRAYVNGWTVEKPKRYGVWVPHVTGKMYFKDGRGNDGLDIASADCLNESNQQFTLAEIEHYGLQDCERVEVTDDEQ